MAIPLNSATWLSYSLSHLCFCFVGARLIFISHHLFVFLVLVPKIKKIKKLKLLALRKSLVYVMCVFYFFFPVLLHVFRTCIFVTCSFQVSWQPQLRFSRIWMSFSTLYPSERYLFSTWWPTLWFLGAMSWWGRPIHDLHYHSCAHFPSPLSSSSSFGISHHEGSWKPSCLLSPQQLRFQCCKFSISRFHKWESRNIGASPWCHGCHPSPSSWTYFCWGLWTSHPMWGSESFRELPCSCTCSIAFMLALMQKEVDLSIKRTVNFRENQLKKVMIQVLECRYFIYWLVIVMLMDQLERENKEKRKG